jgi:hypothetical protein
MKGKQLKLTNDRRFLNTATVTYPNIHLSTWTILPNGVKPDKAIELFCEFAKIHLKT